MNHITKLLGLTFILLFSVSSHASSSPDFWLAQKGPQKIWLLGSIHIGSPELYPLDSSIDHAWQQADTLVVETSLQQTPEQSRMMARYITLQPGTTLKTKLSQTLYQRTQQTARTYQLNTQQLDRLTPWFVAILLQQKAIERAGYKADYGVDVHFLNLAQTERKQIEYLETPEQQFAYLAQLNRLDVDFLDGTLKDIHDMNTKLPELLTAWQQGDEQRMLSFLNYADTPPALQHFFNVTLLRQRNQHWIPKLQALKTPNNFVVVGAMHLYGPDGLIAQLKNRGYQLTRQTK